MLTFEDLYALYSHDVYRFAIWLAGDGYEAEDITSETFIRAWASSAPIRTETLKAYLFTIARNVYYERLRKRKNEVNIKETHSDTTPGPDSQVESRLELQRIQQVLQTYPEIDRTAFVLRVQHELPYAEIARVLQLSLSTVKVKVHRTRKKLLTTLYFMEVA
ncbi:MAG: RNA polymerase sigma factor [Chloroflexota bacterium]|nr:RNA polymerase sigma factor [Chloroflexota bacterium]